MRGASAEELLFFEDGDLYMFGRRMPGGGWSGRVGVVVGVVVEERREREMQTTASVGKETNRDRLDTETGKKKRGRAKKDS